MFVRHPSPKPTQNPIVDPAAAAAVAPLVAAAHRPLVKRVIDRALARLRRPSNTTSASLSAPLPVARRPSPARSFSCRRLDGRGYADVKGPIVGFRAGALTAQMRFFHLPIPKWLGVTSYGGNNEKETRCARAGGVENTNEHHDHGARSPPTRTGTTSLSVFTKRAMSSAPLNITVSVGDVSFHLSPRPPNDGDDPQSSPPSNSESPSPPPPIVVVGYGSSPPLSSQPSSTQENGGIGDGGIGAGNGDQYFVDLSSFTGTLCIARSSPPSSALVPPWSRPTVPPSLEVDSSSVDRSKVHIKSLID